MDERGDFIEDWSEIFKITVIEKPGGWESMLEGPWYSSGDRYFTAQTKQAAIDLAMKFIADMTDALIKFSENPLVKEDVRGT